MIVVSDTSPLNYLILIDGRTPEVVKEWIQSTPPWLRIHPPASDHRFVGSLGPGEAAAIALAIELGAAAVLIDEKAGRRIANWQRWARSRCSN
jgi:predicted nucleic acid-binding protein